MTRGLFSQPPHALTFDDDVPDLAFRLWNVLARMCGPDESITVTQEDIARAWEKSRPTVQRAQQQLVAAGWLEVTATGRASRYRPLRSRLNPEASDASDVRHQKPQIRCEPASDVMHHTSLMRPETAAAAATGDDGTPGDPVAAWQEAGRVNRLPHPLDTLRQAVVDAGVDVPGWASLGAELTAAIAAAADRCGVDYLARKAAEWNRPTPARSVRAFAERWTELSGPARQRPADSPLGCPTHPYETRRRPDGTCAMCWTEKLTPAR